MLVQSHTNLKCNTTSALIGQPEINSLVDNLLPCDMKAHLPIALSRLRLGNLFQFLYAR